MSFNTGLSGLRAATADLNVTGNNIANASTVGFKQSRAEFGDVYAASLSESGSRTIGAGVLLQKVAQQHTQGNISFTQRQLDLAINGRGFFILNESGERTYTRAGVFGVDKDGYVTSNTGGRLVGYAANSEGEVDLGNEVDLRIQAFNLPPLQTSEVRLGFNVDATAAAPDGALFPAFDPDDQRTFNHASSVSLYDSEGIPHVGTMYYRKDQPDPAIETGVNNDWFVWLEIDGTLVNAGNPANPVNAPLDINGNNSAYLVRFDEDGKLDPATNHLMVDDWVPALQIQSVFDSNAEPLGPLGGAATPTFNGVVDAGTSDFMIDISGSTQFGDDFNIDQVSQNGYGPGQLVGTQVSENGILFARYTNGQSLTLGQILLADFQNAQGLTPLGNTKWGESFESGQAVRGLATAGVFGALQSGALEDSNVDISEELVGLIIAQRNFQANAKTIETNNAITQTIINIRS
ncbi:MAG: flagellar hook protein FlgE [Gammaproteobacteria bacterium]|nr:flagellar hook protein FlgE [Gammaproteobacteria bacterium]